MLPRSYYRWWGGMQTFVAAGSWVMLFFSREAAKVYGLQPFIVFGIGCILMWLADYGSGQKEDE